MRFNYENVVKELTKRKADLEELAENNPDVSFSTMSKIVGGHVKNPGIVTCEHIWRALGKKL